MYYTTGWSGDQDHGVQAFSKNDCFQYLCSAENGVASNGTDRGTWNGRSLHTFYGGGISVIIEGFSPQEYRNNHTRNHQIGEYVWWLGTSAKTYDGQAQGMGVTIHNTATVFDTDDGTNFIGVSFGNGRGGLRGYDRTAADMVVNRGWCEDFSQEGHYLPSNRNSSTRYDIKMDVFMTTDWGKDSRNNGRMMCSSRCYYREKGEQEWISCIRPNTNIEQINFRSGRISSGTSYTERGHGIKDNELFQEDDNNPDHVSCHAFTDGLWVGGKPGKDSWHTGGFESLCKRSAEGYRIAIISQNQVHTSSNTGWGG